MNRSPIPYDVTGVGTAFVSEKQLDFIRGLYGERDLTILDKKQVKFLEEFPLETMTRKQASRVIESLLELPKAKQHTFQHHPEIPAGRYAVDNNEGELRFYIVDRPTEGRWAGYIFVSVLASDEKHPIKGAAKEVILKRIAEDPAGAMNRFGLEIGACGRCGRTLTNVHSRMRGLGPVCAGILEGSYGW